MNAVTIPMGAVQEPERTTRKAWKPGAKDELIYRWVKFEGKRQAWVAEALGISQPTVSRVIERYEKWQAHAEPGDSGRMTPEERKRAQRWLTYERNELILQSALRMAHDLAGSREHTTIKTWRKDWEMEKNYTEEWIDHSGTCCRFLRLAFRVNMEQLKLAELEPLEALEPAEVEEIAEIDRESEVREQEAEEPQAGGQELVANDEETQLTTDNGQLTNAVNKVNNGEAAENGVSEEGAASCDDEGEPMKNSPQPFRGLQLSHGTAANGHKANGSAVSEIPRRDRSAPSRNALPRGRSAPGSGDRARQKHKPARAAATVSSTSP